MPRIPPPHIFTTAAELPGSEESHPAVLQQDQPRPQTEPDQPWGRLGCLLGYLPSQRPRRTRLANASGAERQPNPAQEHATAPVEVGARTQIQAERTEISRSPALPRRAANARARFHWLSFHRPSPHATSPESTQSHAASTDASFAAHAPPDAPAADDEAALSQWHQQCTAHQQQWRTAWSTAIAGIPSAETDPQQALWATAATLAHAADPAVATLNLHALPLPRLPAQTDRLSHLRHMRISAAGLMELPASMDHFADLQTLTLEQNPLRSLPTSLCRLSQLRELSIALCPDLESLPEHLASPNGSDGYVGLVNLRSLQLLGTGIRVLPASIRWLQKLTKLQVMYSPLAQLEIDLQHMPALEELDLQGSALRHYPPVAQGCAPLKRLNLRDCTRLLSLPEDIHVLSQLEELDLRGCVRLQTLPTSLAALPASCIIQVPAHLQAHLHRLRPALAHSAQARIHVVEAQVMRTATGAASCAPALADTELPEQAREDIDRTAHALLSVVIDDERNPFIAGAPSYLPEKRPAGTADTFSQVPALKQMLAESRTPHFLRRVRELAGDAPRIEGISGDELSAHYTAVSNWKAQQNAHLGIVDHLKQYLYHEGSEINASTLAKVVQMWKTRELLVHAHPEDRAHFPEIALHRRPPNFE